MRWWAEVARRIDSTVDRLAFPRGIETRKDGLSERVLDTVQFLACRFAKLPFTSRAWSWVGGFALEKVERWKLNYLEHDETHAPRSELGREIRFWLRLWNFQRHITTTNTQRYTATPWWFLVLGIYSPKLCAEFNCQHPVAISPTIPCQTCKTNSKFSQLQSGEISIDHEIIVQRKLSSQMSFGRI